MGLSPPLKFKIASEEWELEQIHQLNYKTFVEEIPQHELNPNKMLVDKFHKENTYVVCLRGDQLVGMVAVRGERPFSLDEKLENLHSYLPPGRSVCELRLLSVEKNHRSSRVLRGLITLLAQYCMDRRYNLAVISGVLGQQKLYQHLGFVPFGPVVGTEGAKFQPMYLTLESFQSRIRPLLQSRHTRSIRKTLVNLLPGPVAIGQEVREAFAEEPVSHRSENFIDAFHHTQRLLCGLVGSRYVEILMGSGTLANDTIAGQLSLIPGTGLILTNGEFGDRLIDHGTRFGLSFEVFHADWGHLFDFDELKRLIHRNSKVEWIWAVHCETSTGILNDMAMLKSLCAERGIRLCMDCISSTGTVPLDLREIYLASGVSGKGLGAFSGLSMVFHNHKILPAPKSLPRYLDLGLYATDVGTPFTISSNLLHALETALRRFRSESPFHYIHELSIWLRRRLLELGFSIVAPDSHASPGVITIALPETISSERLGRQLEEAGYFLSYKSKYLLKRNWIQICLMGECSKEKMVPLMDLLGQFCHRGLSPSQSMALSLLNVGERALRHD